MSAISDEMIKRYVGEWDYYFLEMARVVATKSKDPSTKVGAVVVNDKRIIVSTGWNGFPRGIDDSEDRLTDREKKYSRTVHAEMNAIYNACYNGVSLDGCTLYIYGLPSCESCSLGIIQVGIRRVVCRVPGDLPEKWMKSGYAAQGNFNEVGVRHTQAHDHPHGASFSSSA